MAGFLMQKGFVLVSIAPNSKNPNKNVFYFNDSTLIKNTISQYLERQ